MIAGWILLLAASVAGQSDVDRMIRACDDNLQLYIAHWDQLEERDETFADAVMGVKGAPSLEEVTHRADEFDRFAEQRLRLRISGMSPPLVEATEKMCNAMKRSYLTGVNNALSKVPVTLPE